jgi:LysR family transcriptional regulator, low CO2-responsive transcriptional regulator
MNSKLYRTTLAQLRSFEAVARLGGITKAAHALHLTQPTVSVQMRELAAALEVGLFVPIGRGIKLTESGECLYRAVVAMKDAWQVFEDELADLSGLVTGRLRIAGVTTTEYFLAQWLKSFTRAYPTIEIDLVVENRDAVVKRLDQGLDDLAVMMMPPKQTHIASSVVMENPLVLIGAASRFQSTAGKQRRMATKQLLAMPLLMREEGSGTRKAVIEFFAQHQAVPQVHMTLGSNEAIKHAVAADLGLAIVSSLALSKHPEREGIAVVPVVGLPIRRNWHWVWRTDRPLSRAAQAFQAFVRAPG